MVAGAKRASCWLACLAPLLCASKWFGEGCARVEDALVRPPKVILHPKSASPPKRWPSWPCLGWAVPHNRAFPRPILRRGLFHRPILRRGLCYARSREEGFVTPDPQNRALLRPIPTPGDPDPDAPIPQEVVSVSYLHRIGELMIRRMCQDVSCRLYPHCILRQMITYLLSLHSASFRG